MTGETFGGSSPSISCRSVLQTPHTFTRTRTSPSSGLGSGNSPYSSGFVPTFAGVRRKQAFIVPPQLPVPPHTEAGGQHTCCGTSYRKVREREREACPSAYEGFPVSPADVSRDVLASAWASLTFFRPALRENLSFLPHLASPLAFRHMKL